MSGLDNEYKIIVKGAVEGTGEFILPIQQQVAFRMIMSVGEWSIVQSCGRL